MQIAAVEAFLLSCPLPEPLRLRFWGGERTILKRDAMLVRITTTSGLRGYGPGPAHERAAREIREIIGPWLIGKDPRRVRELAPGSDRELLKTYRCVEIALLDLIGRHEGCAVSELIGGRKRDDIKLYGSAGMYMPPELYAEEAAAVQAMGFSAYKMRPALGPEGDLRTVELMRRATGDGFGLMLDAHAWWRMGDRSYGFAQVESVARELSRYDLVWLEEPLPPEDHAGYRRLRELGHVPVATGEHEPDEAGFMDLIERGATDFVQMDVCCQGGFAMGDRVVRRLAGSGARFAFHSWGTALEVIAAAHFGICHPASVVEWLEYPCYRNAGRAGMYPFALADQILKEPLDVHAGVLTVPKGSGLGVEIDERVIEQYPFIPGPWSYFRIDSPPETIAVTGDHSVKWVDAAATEAGAHG
jgi:L-alanine-DL-glutamate epimerase-like enolase superfamily enzyme